MRIFARDYDFYELPEEDRKALVGDSFYEDEDIKRMGGTDGAAVYFPVQLTEDGQWVNYGRRQGVLCVSQLWPARDYSKPKAPLTNKLWFKVYCFSPDDLDLALEWQDSNAELREKVLELVRQMPKDEVEYRECLEFIQSYYGGEIGL